MQLSVLQRYSYKINDTASFLLVSVLFPQKFKVTFSCFGTTTHKYDEKMDLESQTSYTESNECRIAMQ